MKTNSATQTIPALASVVALATLLNLCPPASGQPATPRLDPASGLPLPENTESTRGEPVTNSGVTNPALDPSMVSSELRELINYGRYAEALQRCQAFHDQDKTTLWTVILSDWIELGRRYPEAKTNLMKIRDDDLREFAGERGYGELFSEVNIINHALHQDHSTYELFNTLRAKDPELAEECFPVVIGLLVSQGEYQYCYEHLGDPQRHFNRLHENLDRLLGQYRNAAAVHQHTVSQAATVNQKFGISNAGMFPDHTFVIKELACNNFVGGTRLLIEILVATGHKEDAVKIRDQAVVLYDDPRLKSAISDAEAKINQSRPSPVPDDQH